MILPVRSATTATSDVTLMWKVQSIVRIVLQS